MGKGSKRDSDSGKRERGLGKERKPVRDRDRVVVRKREREVVR